MSRSDNDLLSIKKEKKSKKEKREREREREKDIYLTRAEYFGDQLRLRQEE
jgi:hypothetical protein